MMKRLQLILTSIAVISLATVFIIDISQFGEDWSNFGKYIDMQRLSIIVLINIAAGLFLGLFLFYKRPYKKRILLTLPIAFILFSIANFGNMLVHEYGLNDEYNYFTAKRDIKKGKVQLLSTGLILELPTEAEEAIEKQFGFKTVWIGCTVRPGVDRYNVVMEEHLDKMNGKGWKKRLQQKIDSLRNFRKLQ